MIGNRRLGIGSAAEVSSFSFTHAAQTGTTVTTYDFRIATSTGCFIMVDSANRTLPTTGATTTDTNTLSVPVSPQQPIYTSYNTTANGATSCTVFSTDSTGKKSGTITQLEFTTRTLLAPGALNISKCARSLTFLDIGDQTNISSVTGLSSCRALTKLLVDSCAFTTLDCSTLTELVTVEAMNQSSLTAFTAGPKLKSLTIFNCPALPTAAFALEPANATLEFLDCSDCSSLSNLAFARDSAYLGRSIRLTALKVLDVSNTGQQGVAGNFWPSYSKATVVSITAKGLPYISSLSLAFGTNTGAWPALTTLNLSGSTLENDPWRIPTTVSALNLTNIAFGETAEIGINMTDCTLLREELGNVLSIVGATYSTSNTTTTVRQLILDGSGFDTINIAGDPVLLTLSAQGMPNLQAFALTNTAWLKTIQIRNNPYLRNVTITGTTNRTLADIAVTISGNSALTTRTLTGAWTNKTPLPTITSVTPTYGRLAAGTPITISGTNLTSAYIVTVNGVAATSVVAVSATSITAVTPAGAAGQKSVLVTTIRTSATTTAPATNFNYQTIPTFTAMSPTNMLAAGGTINLTGSGFLSVADPNLGVISFQGAGTLLTNIVINSDTSITATVPPRSATSGWAAGLPYPKAITIINSYGSKTYGGTAALGFYYTT